MYEGDNLRRYKRFERLANKAEKKDQFAAAINAEYRSGQLAGAFIDRKEVKVTGLEGMSREELENKLSELSQKIDGYNAKTIEAEPEQAEDFHEQKAGGTHSAPGASSQSQVGLVQASTSLRWDVRPSQPARDQVAVDLSPS